jgi:hypothetical protein
MGLAQQSSAVSSIDLASSLHSSLETLLDSDIERMYEGMNRFDASMVRSHNCPICTHQTDRCLSLQEWLLSRMNMILEQENRMTEVSHLQV